MNVYVDSQIGKIHRILEEMSQSNGPSIRNYAQKIREILLEGETVKIVLRSEKS